MHCKALFSGKRFRQIISLYLLINLYKIYIHRPCGKESTKVRKSQNKGKESENLPETEEITEGQAHENTWKLYRDISTGTAVFINRKRVNVCEHTTKMASPESL